MQAVRMQQYINSAMLTARCLKTKLQKGTRQIKDSKAEKTKDGEGRGHTANQIKKTRGKLIVMSMAKIWRH